MMLRAISLFLLVAFACQSNAMAMQLGLRGYQVFDFMRMSTVCPQQEGQNISPGLTWRGVPTKAKSLLLLLHDPDAGHMSGFVHWVVYIDDPAVGFLDPGNKLGKEVVFAKNGHGQSAYFGPCPPAGTGVHRYNFTLYALSKRLDPQKVKSMNRSQLVNLIYKNVIAQAVFTLLYRNALDESSTLATKPEQQ